MDQKLIDRIQALYAKAESTTFAAEREAFLSKVNELIEKHALDLAEVITSGQQAKSSVTHDYFEYAKSKGEVKEWKQYVIGSIARLCFCDAVLIGWKKICIIGTKENIELTIVISERVIQELLIAVEADAAKAKQLGYIKAQGLGGSHPRAWRQLYLKAAAFTILERVNAIIKIREAPKPRAPWEASTSTNLAVISAQHKVENKAHSAEMFGDRISVKKPSDDYSSSRSAEFYGDQAGRRARISQEIKE